MKTITAIHSDIERIVNAHYYSEDFHLLSEFQSYAAGLNPQEQSNLAEVVFDRLIRDGSLVDIMLCQVAHVSSAAPVLAEKLSNEPQTNQVTRTLIATLSHYASDDAYVAVERFLDSDQEMESLQALARIDFTRALPAIVRRMKKDHYAGAILQILHERMKKVGLPALAGELRQTSATKFSGFAGILEKILRSKDASYNPIARGDADALLAQLR